MPRDYNINVGWSSDKRAYGDVGNVYTNKSTLNRRGMSDDGGGVTKSNLSRVFTVGLGFNLAQKGNEAFGAYTNDRLKQRKVNVGMTFAKYGIGIAINPAIGLTYAVGDLGYRAVMYGIGIQKQNREAQYYRRLSGNNAHSGRRYGGSYL